MGANTITISFSWWGPNLRYRSVSVLACKFPLEVRILVCCQPQPKTWLLLWALEVEAQDFGGLGSRVGGLEGRASGLG